MDGRAKIGFAGVTIPPGQDRIGSMRGFMVFIGRFLMRAPLRVSSP
jgi:hypothetical protein